MTRRLDELRAQLELAREESEACRARFGSIIERNADGIIVLDVDGIVQFANPAAEEIFSQSKAQLIGQGFGFPASAGVVDEIEVLRSGTSTIIAEMRVVETTWKGQAAYLISLRDITERRQAFQERERLLAEVERRAFELQAANQELEAFTYAVSHDLRAPLRHIDSFSRILLQDYSEKLDEQGQRYLQILCRSSEKMSDLIDDLLNLSRLTRADMRRQKVELSAIVWTIIDDLRQAEPGRQIEPIVAPGIIVDGDAHLLRIALENLLRNAWKFTSQLDRARIEFGIAQREDQQIYFVRDDGVGFDMNYADKLFLPFQRLHKADAFPGNGIGLATVHRIIRRHGGQIWAEAEVGKGSTFYFTLGETSVTEI